MAPHPILRLAADRETRQSKGFREVAARITAEDLAASWEEEIAGAPRRDEAGKGFLGKHPKKVADKRRPGKDEDHVGQALVRWADGGKRGLALPEEGEVALIDWQVPRATAKADKAAGESDPNWGVGKIDAIGLGPDDRLAVVMLQVVEPTATRTGTGETPLRLLLQGLAHVAIAQANREALCAEVAEQAGRTPSGEPPALYLAATPRYWELCRKREAQKGAAWIKELERLSLVIEESLGVPVTYLGLALEGDPGWSYDEGGPALDGDPELRKPWERTAGRVKPKPRARARKAAVPEDVIVEADLSRPVRPYGITDSFASGDRIQHPTLGMGVVQGEAGPGKIHVLFGEKKSLLVHERQPGA